MFNPQNLIFFWNFSLLQLIFKYNDKKNLLSTPNFRLTDEKTVPTYTISRAYRVIRDLSVCINQYQGSQNKCTCTL